MDLAKFLIQIKIKEKFDDYVTYLILGVIIGGRIGYDYSTTLNIIQKI